MPNEQELPPHPIALKPWQEVQMASYNRPFDNLADNPALVKKLLPGLDSKPLLTDYLPAIDVILEVIKDTPDKSPETYNSFIEEQTQHYLEKLIGEWYEPHFKPLLEKLCFASTDEKGTFVLEYWIEKLRSKKETEHVQDPEEIILAALPTALIGAQVDEDQLIQTVTDDDPFGVGTSSSGVWLSIVLNLRTKLSQKISEDLIKLIKSNWYAQVMGDIHDLTKKNEAMVKVIDIEYHISAIVSFSAKNLVNLQNIEKIYRPLHRQILQLYEVLASESDDNYRDELKKLFCYYWDKKQLVPSQIMNIVNEKVGEDSGSSISEMYNRLFSDLGSSITQAENKQHTELSEALKAMKDTLNVPDQDSTQQAAELSQRKSIVRCCLKAIEVDITKKYEALPVESKNESFLARIYNFFANILQMTGLTKQTPASPEPKKHAFMAHLPMYFLPVLFYLASE